MRESLFRDPTVEEEALKEAREKGSKELLSTIGQRKEWKELFALQPDTDAMMAKLPEAMNRANKFVSAMGQLESEPADEERLRFLFGDEEAERAMAMGGKRDRMGAPIILETEFGITEQETRATQLYFGLLDGQQRNLSQVSEAMDLPQETAERAVKATVQKLRGDLQSPVVLPERQPQGQ